MTAEKMLDHPQVRGIPQSEQLGSHPDSGTKPRECGQFPPPNTVIRIPAYCAALLRTK